MSDPQTTAWLDQEDAHTSRLIREHRFVVTYVWPCDHDDPDAVEVDGDYFRAVAL